MDHNVLSFNRILSYTDECTWQNPVYLFARVAITKYQRLGGLNKGDLLSQRAGDQKSEIKV